MKKFFDSKQGYKDIRPVEVVKWLDWAANPNSNEEGSFFLALPVIQRNSVWKPNQVIELWDSLFRGMPIGSMLARECAPGTPARRIGSNDTTLSKVPEGGGLELIDGHQRMLAMLAGWPRQNDIAEDLCLWIDFADEPLPGQLLRLRLTTKNHPFGFNRYKPASKLSLDERRKARDAFKDRHGEDIKPSLDKTEPYSNTPSLPVRMKWIIEQWKRSPNTWKEELIIQLQRKEAYRKSEEENDKHRIENCIESLEQALERLLELKLPIVRLDECFFDSKKEKDNDDPALEVLFRRIGTNGTPLSPGDYAYSILKNRKPDIYEFVEQLHEKNNVASLLTATDLVMSAIRLAATKPSDSHDHNSRDPENPNIRDLGRLLRNDSFIKDRLLPLIRSGGKNGTIDSYFEAIHDTLLFDDIDNPNGLPKQAFPLLKRPLVQVLLRLAQIGYLTRENRDEGLRLVMFWLIAVTNVTNEHKASRLAYEVILESLENGRNIVCESIYRKILDADPAAAVCLPTPEAILKVPKLACSSHENRIFGESRFKDDKNDQREGEVRGFYRNYWWQPWTHQHPILLWIQRKMVAIEFKDNDPMAGRDEETPYDYDHILPQAHWGNWTGIKKGTRLIDLPEEEEGGHTIIGNSIGNIQVISFSDNRSYGDKPPREKLELNKPDKEKLSDRAINENQIKDWCVTSGAEGRYREWDLERALAFQRAVEKRTFDLYKRYYNDLDFKTWNRKSPQ